MFNVIDQLCHNKVKYMAENCGGRDKNMKHMHSGPPFKSWPKSDRDGVLCCWLLRILDTEKNFIKFREF